MSSEDLFGVRDASLHVQKAGSQGAVEQELREAVHQGPMERNERLDLEMAAKARTDREDHRLELRVGSSCCLLSGGEFF